MADLRFDVGKGEVFVGALRNTGELACPRQTKDEQIQNKTIVLNDEARKLQSSDESVRIGMHHVLVAD